MRDMRPLIRPTLFAFARLGLFLTVLAWGVGQRWIVKCLVSPNNGNMIVNLLPEGVLITFSGARLQDRIDFRMLRQSTPPRSNDWEFGGPYEQNSIHGERVLHWNLPGLVRGEFDWYSFLSVRYWLIALAFLALNILLHFIYRIRPEAPSCES